MGPTWDPPGADRTQVGPMLAPWTLLSGYRSNIQWWYTVNWNFIFAVCISDWEIIPCFHKIRKIFSRNMPGNCSLKQQNAIMKNLPSMINQQLIYFFYCCFIIGCGFIMLTKPIISILFHRIWWFMVHKLLIIKSLLAILLCLPHPSIQCFNIDWMITWKHFILCSPKCPENGTVLLRIL